MKLETQDNNQSCLSHSLSSEYRGVYFLRIWRAECRDIDTQPGDESLVGQIQNVDDGIVITFRGWEQLRDILLFQLNQGKKQNAISSRGLR